MEKILEISTIDEEFEKSRVKAHTRTRKGKLERVREFSKKGDVSPARMAAIQKWGKLVDTWVESRSFDERARIDKLIDKMESTNKFGKKDEAIYNHMKRHRHHDD
jgi:hypothetical protein